MIQPTSGVREATRLFTDTDPAIEQLLIEQIRRLSPARKLEMMAQFNAAMRSFALAGLRSRHPDEDEATLRRRLADLLLGPALAAQFLGPMPEKSPVKPVQS